jgi:hypothetical protein
MTTQITITLPDEIYQRAERFALLANRDLNSVIADTIGSSLSSMRSHFDSLEPIESLSNSQVLALSNLQMDPGQDLRLSELLEKQRERELNANEPQELETLMQIYREALLRKTAALVETVKRGIRESVAG